jgi:hypothetical protein
MVSHALWDMLQATVIVPATEARWLCKPIHPKLLASPVFHPWQMRNTKTNLLGKEIKSTFTDSATVNQLPQSGIG